MQPSPTKPAPTPARLTHDDRDYLEGLVNEPMAARLLGVTARALQNWRVRGGGPPFVKISARCVRYQRGALLAWRSARQVSSTSKVPSASEDAL